jgi:hypothetical protein
MTTGMFVCLLISSCSSLLILFSDRESIFLVCCAFFHWCTANFFFAAGPYQLLLPLELDFFLLPLSCARTRRTANIYVCLPCVFPRCTANIYVVTPRFKDKSECIEHMCARIKLHTYVDSVNTKTQCKSVKEVL